MERIKTQRTQITLFVSDTQEPRLTQTAASSTVSFMELRALTCSFSLQVR